MYDIIIVGAGTAGLSAAIYGARAGKKVLVLEKETYGGQIIKTSEIENYPGIKNVSGYEFATNLYEQATSLGAEVVFEKVIQVQNGIPLKSVTTEKKEYKGKTIILATGVKNRPLGLENEEAFTGRGISYCATCDGAFYRGKTVAVAGGGNTAIEDALILSALCKKVYVIHRRDSFRAEEKLVEELQKMENVEFLLNKNILSVSGEPTLKQIEIKDKETNEISVISVDGLFVAIGQVPENDNFSDLVDLDQNGYIAASENCKTNIPGIFTAGDSRTKEVRQLATAAADGAVAALAASEYLARMK